MITPEELIKNHSIEYFCKKSDEYYANMATTTLQLGKPFTDLRGASTNILMLGMLLSGLQLGKSMRVLDFGAGTCWLSRFLNQLGCITVSVDVSKSALDLGKKLFREYPIIGQYIAPPEFCLSDGHTIPLEDQSVDRIVCFDTFHHVPNQENILKEIYRILKPGCIAGFAEPGIGHSKTTVSQYEMANYGVLENDIILEDIWAKAAKAGFTEISIMPLLPIGYSTGFKEYCRLIKKRRQTKQMKMMLSAATRGTSIFYLLKGATIFDSRIPYGLNCRIEISPEEYSFRTNEPVEIDCKITNTGKAKWLHDTPYKIGEVLIGCHLYDAAKNLINLDFMRIKLDHDIDPGQCVSKKIPVILSKAETFYLGIDMVSEQVTWFEFLGNEVSLIRLNPEKNH